MLLLLPLLLSADAMRMSTSATAMAMWAATPAPLHPAAISR